MKNTRSTPPLLVLVSASLASLFLVDAAPAHAQGAPARGRIERIQRFASKALGNTRDIFVYLPPGYDTDRARRYPVIYAHDGQNLFDRNAFHGGWQADAVLDAGIAAGRIAPVILVGAANTPGRMSEYTPTRDPRHGGGGADRYLDFLEGELKPDIDRRYRTLPDARNTGILGSSLGGLVSFYAGWKRPHVFGNVAAMSPSLWWDGARLVNEVKAFTGTRPAARFYIDSGGAQDGADLCMTLRDTLAGKGYRFGEDLFHWVEWSHQHNEVAWRARLPRVLESLFPAKPAGSGGAGGGGSNPPPPPPPSKGVRTVIRVHFDTGLGHAISVRGDASGWDRWMRPQRLRWTPGNVWVLETTAIAPGQPFQFKVVYDDRLFERGRNRAGVGGGTFDIYPRF